MQTHLTIIILCTIIVFIVSFLALYFLVRDWDNQDFAKSPLINSSSFMMIRSIFNSVVSWKLDINSYSKM